MRFCDWRWEIAKVDRFGNGDARSLEEEKMAFAWRL